jgi:hypothetical protein
MRTRSKANWFYRGDGNIPLHRRHLPVIERANLPGVRSLEDVVNETKSIAEKQYLINSFIIIIECIEQQEEVLPNKDYQRSHLRKSLPRLRSLALADKAREIIRVLEELPERPLL